MSRVTHITGQYFLNGLLEESELRRQTAAFASAGYEEIYLHARIGLRTPYLSQKWFDAVAAVVDEAEKHGLAVSIWDEDGYPSGFVGNRIKFEHPELQAQYLISTQIQVSAGCAIEYVFDSVEPVFYVGFVAADGTISNITEFCGSLTGAFYNYTQSHPYSSSSMQVGAPHRRCSTRRRGFGILWTPEQDGWIVAVQISRNVATGHNTDLMNPETTDKILNYTHEEYVRRFGRVFLSSFTDEPGPGGRRCSDGKLYPWTGNFAEEFLRDHGQNIVPLLPHLFMDIDGRTPVIRDAYRRTQQRLLTQNYLEKLRVWCAENGAQSVGHLMRTEAPRQISCYWPDELACYRFLDIPCCDPLGRLMGWPDASAHHFGIKVVSSAARHFGKARAGSDILAVTGNETALRDMKFIMNYHMALGVTYFNIDGLHYSYAGERKADAPGSYSLQHSEWPLMGDLLREVKLLAEQVELGVPECQLAVLYPDVTLNTEAVDSAWETRLHLLMEELLARQIEFDLIDGQTLEEQFYATPKALAAKYPRFIVPEARFIACKTAELLEKYVACGGQLQIRGALPRLLDGRATVWNIHAGAGMELPTSPLEGQHPERVLAHRRSEGVLLFNRSGHEFSGFWEGRAVTLAGGEARFLRPGEEIPDWRSIWRSAVELTHWSLTFPANHLVLPCWEIDEKYHEPGDPEMINLLCRDATAPSGVRGYFSRFMFSGRCERLTLRLDRETFTRPGWSCLVNGIPATAWRDEAADWLDCDISELVRGGEFPSQNRIDLIGEQLNEAPYLIGDFAGEYSFARRELPFLAADSGKFELDRPVPWSNLGRGGYSGPGTYETDFSLDEAGTFLLALERVEDAVGVWVDGRRVGAAVAPPYRVELGRLEPGTHRLKIEVWNAPGNRDLLAGLASGLLGKAELYKRQGNKP